MKNDITCSTISIKRIIIKAIFILIIFNFGWILLTNLPIGDLSLYNLLFEGRYRLPFGENPKRSYNLSLFNIDAMFSSHEINGKPTNEDDFNVVLIGDSSIWGIIQEPDETLSGLLNKRFTEKYNKIVFHNIGYPSISVFKDLMLIDRVIEYNPDLILWFTTLEALPKSKQLDIPINKNNPRIANSIIEKYKLTELRKFYENYLESTFWNQRRNISDLLNLQLYGILWDATGIDQEYPETYNHAQRDFYEPIEQYYGINPDDNIGDFLGLEIMKKGIEINSGTDFILINEPILISEGVNNSIQYNYYYPRWAYDQYRLIMKEFTKKNGFAYFDFWDLIPQEKFTNSAIHLSKDAERKLAEEITFIVEDYMCQDVDNENK